MTRFDTLVNIAAVSESEMRTDNKASKRSEWNIFLLRE